MTFLPKKKRILDEMSPICYVSSFSIFLMADQSFYYFMINLYKNIGPSRDGTRDPWICSQTRICCQTRYRLGYAVMALTPVMLLQPETVLHPLLQQCFCYISDLTFVSLSQKHCYIRGPDICPWPQQRSCQPETVLQP